MPFPDSYVQAAMGVRGSSAAVTKADETPASAETKPDQLESTTSSKSFNSNQQKWIDTLPDDDAVQNQCAETAAAQEKECGEVRRRVEKKLENLGCPSYVSPKYTNGVLNPDPNNPVGSGCGCPQQQQQQTTCNTCNQQQSTATTQQNVGTCQSGTCSL